MKTRIKVSAETTRVIEYRQNSQIVRITSEDDFMYKMVSPARHIKSRTEWTAIFNNKNAAASAAEKVKKGMDLYFALAGAVKVIAGEIIHEKSK